MIRYVYNTNKWHQDYCRVEGCKDNYNDKFIVIDNTKFTKLNHFSDNNHIVSTNYYKQYLLPKLSNFSFPEYQLRCYPIINNDHSFYYLGDINDGYFIKHIDGRNTTNEVPENNK